MPAQPRVIRFSLLLSLAILVVFLASPTATNALSHDQHLDAALRHKRMIKVRAHPEIIERAQGSSEETADPSSPVSNKQPDGKGLAISGGNAGPGGGVSGVGPEPVNPGTSLSSSVVATLVSSTTSAPVTSSTKIDIPNPLTLLSSIVSVSSSASVSVSSASASLSSSSVLSSTTVSSSIPLTTTTSSTTSVAVIPSPPPTTTSITSIEPHITGTSTIFLSPSSSVAAVIQAAVSTTHDIRRAITVIAAIAASVGGVALIWTLFRKWKLRPSKAFSARTAPIDWEPTTNERDETMQEKVMRRRNSGSSFRSFDSHGHSIQSHAPSVGAPSMTHDFTAGPSNLGPNGGYADLRRGPSPGPQMMQQQQPYGGQQEFRY